MYHYFNNNELIQDQMKHFYNTQKLVTYLMTYHACFLQGGFDGCTGLSTAEVLDLSLPIQNSPFGFQSSASGSGPVSISGREWRPIASMSTRYRH